MDAESSTQLGTIRKRSRAGCYTCKFRKVRCEAVSSQKPNNDGVLPDCPNCERLGFQCRWIAPASGEPFAPPPKRRRTIGRRSTYDRGTSNKKTPIELNQSQDDEQNAHATDAHSPEALPASQGLEVLPGQTADLSSGFLQEYMLDSNFAFGSGPLDLNLAGEGLDFIPVPTVDPSVLLTGSELTHQTPQSLEWPPMIHLPDMTRHQMAIGNESSSLVVESDFSPSVNDDNRQLVQHYLEVMKGYSKVDERSKDVNNLFISTFSQSLFFPPLFYAILAFSASHLSIQDESYTNQATAFDRLAATSFDTFKRDHATEVEGLLSALFVRIKQVHVMGGSTKSFLELIAAAAEIVATEQGASAVKDPSALTRRIILRLAILDSRAACYRLGGGTLIAILKRIPCLSFIFDHDIKEVASLGAVVNLLRANILRAQVAETDLRLHELEDEFITSRPIRTDTIKRLYSDIRNEIHRWERYIDDESPVEDPVDEEVLDSRVYSSYAIVSALHSALLYLNYIYPLPSINQELSISVILQYQLRVHRDSSRADSPSSILPSSLFLAGLLTEDPIHRDWIIKVFRTGEQWGLYIRKTRELLEAMLKMQARGVRLDVCDAMDKFTGRFII
ncbi:hypothetical protein BGZ63DRAFT_36681 [Mariannaea sp. PMI_226]|nr:hypothetical protein BGZ63DRAFT_36681 [Mariannaea sp. PMI_226]